jgi:hypothetical protein
MDNKQSLSPLALFFIHQSMFRGQRIEPEFDSSIAAPVPLHNQIIARRRSRNHC